MTRRRIPVLLAAAISVLSMGCARPLTSASGEAVGIPVDVNDVGTILNVRYDGTRPHGMLLTGVGGVATRIDGPDGTGFLPYAINRQGVVVGATIAGEGRDAISRAVVWTGVDGLISLPLPEGTFQSWAADINDRGDIAVNAYAPSGSPGDGAYLVRDRETLIRLTDPPGAANGRPSVAEALNDGGTVVGASGHGLSTGSEQAIEWEPTTRAPRVLEADGPVSRAFDINEQGTIVGAATNPAGGGTNVAIWLSTGAGARRTLDLGPGAASSVNERDIVVGQDATVTPPQAAAWSAPGGAGVRLGELVPGTGSNATALNNAGLAVGESNGVSTYFARVA